MKSRIFLIVLCLGCLILVTSCAQNLVKIEDIFENPGKYENEKVVISGIVNQYFPSTTKTTSYYMVQGNYGGEINVNTTLKPPVTFKKYQITGVVVIDQVQGRPVIIEKSRKMVQSWIFYALGGAVILLIGFLIIYILRTRKNNASSVSYASASASPDYATIKISSGPPPTMILIPGELEIISGLDKGKSFRIAGYPTSEGSIVSLGREIIEGDRKYAHIQLLEKTVSRRQAELIFKNSLLFIKNLSETNFTQVDGKTLSINESVELRSGVVIKTGEVEFRYNR
jgi:hypothetical protein